MKIECQPYYAKGKGRPSVPPGVYFRMLLVGYFEGIQSQRGIAWRCSDSLSLRKFLGVPLGEESPDHSSLINIRHRLPLTVHQQVFVWMLALAERKKLLQGKTMAVDSTTLDPNAAMKSIVRRADGRGLESVPYAADERGRLARRARRRSAQPRGTAQVR